LLGANGVGGACSGGGWLLGANEVVGGWLLEGHRVGSEAGSDNLRVGGEGEECGAEDGLHFDHLED
jgi:hypothetical protein